MPTEQETRDTVMFVRNMRSEALFNRRVLKKKALNALAKEGLHAYLVHRLAIDKCNMRISLADMLLRTYKCDVLETTDEEPL